MGLRMWRESDEENSVDDVAAKLDRTAAARRSTIRREPSIRPSRDHAPPPQSISGFLRSRHQNIVRTRDRLREEEAETDTQIAALQAELDRLRRVRLRNRVRLIDELEASQAGRDAPDTTSPTDEPSQDENNRSSHDTSLDADSQPLPRPPRESNLRFELMPRSTSRSRSPWRYQISSRTTTMPSPPRSADSDRRDLTIPDGPIPGESWTTAPTRLPALTEGFAPARAASSSASAHGAVGQPDEDVQGLETPPPESWEASYPPLHRVGHTSPRPVSRVDGLGDRRRSLSPLSDQNEEDTWMSALLTTMDTSRSSSASSFTSSQGDTLRRSNNSSQTTSTSFGEIGSLDDTCELDLPDGITEDDVRAIRERHFPPSRRDFTDLHVILAGRALRNHMDRTGNTDHAMFQAILDRMQRREPIPTDWWATVGLPRNMTF